MRDQKHEIIGVASGKGGVGKTTVSVNLALALSRQKKKVVLIDADLGLANTQITLGINAPFNISDVIAGRKEVSEVAVNVDDNLILVPGASGNKEMANLNPLQTQSLLQGVFDSFKDIELVIIDMAAGLSDSCMTFFRACDLKIIVAQDEPASLADAYGLIKLQHIEQRMSDILLLPNRVSNQTDGRTLFNKLNGVCMRFLEEPIKYVQSIQEDQALLLASRKRQNLFEDYPNSRAVKDFNSLAETITNSFVCD